MNRNQIEELIAQGENSSVEFKSQEVRAESVARELAAFSNTSGGVVLIGVEDDGRVTGMHRLGRGIPMILKEMGSRVTFEEVGELFRVTVALRPSCPPRSRSRSSHRIDVSHR